MTGPRAFVDLHALTEDERIAIIADTVMKGLTAAFVVEDDEKADRYLRKLGGVVTVGYRGPGPAPGVWVRVSRALN